jgi:hypothetical protein
MGIVGKREQIIAKIKAEHTMLECVGFASDSLWGLEVLAEKKSKLILLMLSYITDNAFLTILKDFLNM